MRRKREFAWDPGEMALYFVGGSDVQTYVDVGVLLKLWREIQAELHEAVEALPDAQRAVIEAVYWERATYEEIAVRLGYRHRSSVLRVKRAAEAALKHSLEVSGCSTKWHRFNAERRCPAKR